MVACREWQIVRFAKDDGNPYDAINNYYTSFKMQAETNSALDKLRQGRLAECPRKCASHLEAPSNRYYYIPLQEVLKCQKCGCVWDRDVNAALNMVLK